MRASFLKGRFDIYIALGILFLVSISVILLRSINPSLFPLYFVYIFLGLILFYIFSKIDFDIYLLFAKHFYIASVFLLILPLIIGRVTRGTVRWIPIGALSIQPAEIVRPFLIVFFVTILIGKDLDLKLLARAIVLLVIPVILIVVQPSLGVSILTVISFVGVLVASSINKKSMFALLLVGLATIPIVLTFLAPYQRQRIISFLSPASDPLGAGYNSIQSMIAVGAGKVLGRGLGKGVQTQLAFLPERHTDFIFAAASEELGFVGGGAIILGIFFVLYRLTVYLRGAPDPYSRAYLSGLFLVLFSQTFINIGMNLGILPITGLPLPLVSAGGSSYLATMIALGIAVSTRK